MRTYTTQVSSAVRIAAASAALVATIGLATPAAQAQETLRPDQPEVIRPAPPPGPPPTPDFVGEFRQRYGAAGSPRIMLFWNVELSDRGRAEIVLRDNESKTGVKTGSVQGQPSVGWDGSTTTNSTTRVQSNRQREIGIGERQDAKRANLPQRDAIIFERAFESEMRNTGARLVDRTMAVRSTATEKSADGQQQLEAEAVRGKADLLLQVLFIADSQAPLGYGFDVTMRDVNSGIVLTSFYTVAAPPSPHLPQSYLATGKGFERPAPPQLMLDDVAVQLAHEIMNQVGPVLPMRTGARSQPR